MFRYLCVVTLVATALLRGWMAITLLGLSACALQPYDDEPDDPKSVKAPAFGSPLTREKLAATYTEQGRYADALLQWKILSTRYPDNAGYAAHVQQTEEHIDKLAAQRQRAGLSALDKGDHATARHELLAALVLDPARTNLLDYLRRIEYDRVWSIQSAKLEKLKTTEDRKASSIGEQERSYFELGTLMYRTGDYTGAVREVQKYLNSYPGDAQAKKLIGDAYAKLSAQQRQQGLLHNALANAEQAKRFSADNTAAHRKAEQELRDSLADEYYEKGMRALRSDLKLAIQSFEKALEYNPQHAKARTKLADAQRMQKKLEEIGK